MQTDDHLRTALRHAPDASSAAPIALSALISAAAREATRDDKGNVWSRLWAWLGQPGRLGASGAFATLALAGVLTLVWHGETPAPMVERPTAMAPAPAAPTVTDSASAGPALTQPAPVQATTASAPPTVAAKTAARAEARAAAAAPTAAPAASAAPAPVQEAVAEATPTRTGDAKAAAEAPTAVAPPMARREAAPMSAVPAMPSMPSMPAVPATPAIPAAPAVAAAPAPQAKAAAADSAQERSRFALGSNRVAAPGVDIAAWLDAATERPSAAAAMAAPGQPASARRLATAMLSELQSLGAGRWRDSSTPEGTAQVELWQAGRHGASLWLNDDAVVVCLTSAQRCQRAPLSAAQIEALRAMLLR